MANHDGHANEINMEEDESYTKIMHSIKYEGMYSEIIDDDEYVNEDAIAMGPPIIYTEEEEEAMMKELNDGMFFPTPKTSRTTKRQQDLAPICICKIKTIGGIPLDRPLICLFDTGSTGVMINRRVLPPGCFIDQRGERVRSGVSHVVCVFA